MKPAVSAFELKGTSSKHRKKTQSKISIVGRDEWFTRMIILKGRVINPATMNVFGMNELMEKIKNQGWTHLFMCSLLVIYYE